MYGFKKDRKTIVRAIPGVNKGLPTTYIEARGSDLISHRAIAIYRDPRVLAGNDRPEEHIVSLPEDSEIIGRRIDAPEMAGVLMEWQIYNKF